MSDRTRIVAGPAHSRRKMRKLERDVTAALPWAGYWAPGGYTPEFAEVAGVVLPTWTRGVRVERVGLTQWALVATEHEGH